MAFGYLGMICNGVQIVEVKKADLDIALIEIHPESKNYVFSLSLFSIPVVCGFKFVGNLEN